MELRAEADRRQGDQAPPEFGRLLLDSLAYAFIVVDGEARVFFANDVARRVASELNGLYIADNTLHAAIDAEDVELRAAIAAAARRDGSCASVSGFLRLTVGKMPIPVMVLPAHVEADPLLGAQRVAFVVFCGEDRLHRDLRITMYQLTCREADLVSALLAGMSLAEAARALKVTIHTARTHLKHAMEKTGTARQADLVRVLLRSNLPPNSRGYLGGHPGGSS